MRTSRKSMGQYTLKYKWEGLVYSWSHSNWACLSQQKNIFIGINDLDFSQDNGKDSSKGLCLDDRD